MTDGAKVFNLHGNEAMAMYKAATIVLAMMYDAGEGGKDFLELNVACERWCQFCHSRGVEVPTVTQAMKMLRRSAEVKVL